MSCESFDPTSWMSESHLAVGLKPRPDGLPKHRHRQIVDRVCHMFQACKRDQGAAPEAYQPGGEWVSYLEERRAFYDGLLAGDVDDSLLALQHFWRNELGPIVKEYAKYQELAKRRGDTVARFQRGIIRNYLIWREIFSFPVSALDVPDVGDPWGYIIDGQLVVPKATRFNAHATALRNLLAGIPQPVVGEIGGGYGGLAYYLLRDAKGTTYMNFDLPETLALASYYLLCCLPDRKFFLYGEGSTPLGNDAKAFHAILLPNYSLPQLEDQSVDVFVNSFSLSEVPWDTLVEYLRIIERTVRHYFLHNNMDRTGVFNRGCERIPASSFPIDTRVLKLIYKHFDLFHGQGGDYREFLYERIERPC